jgi:O-antigen ligase
MLNLATEKTLSRILGIGGLATSVFILWQVVTDPVNVTKHFLLGAFAVSAFALAMISGSRTLVRDSKVAIGLISLFLVFAVNAVINSDSPLAQNLYGTYGRNTGFMSYLFFSLIFIAALVIRSKKSFEFLTKALLIAGLINVLYCFWAWQVGDFVGWSNPYNTILGTFGNPNFIGAFLGIFVSVFVAYIAASGTKLWVRIIGGIVILITLLEIKHSNAIQGIVVAAGGISLVVFFLIRSKFRSVIPTIIYVLFVATSGVFAVLGALQKGPLTELIYKRSVSLRGEYWNAGINMGQDFPLTGVGMDSYGDWYRLLRRDSALVVPGTNTVTNAAHNVFLDLLAYGGWPLFISYVAIMILALVSIVKVLARSKSYDWVFVSLAVGWICYQVQALISINQIGLAIWGWIFTGAVIAYEIATRDESKGEPQKNGPAKKSKAGYKGEIISPQLIASLGLVFGGILAVPPLSADMKWSSALRSGSVQVVEAGLQPSYMNPANVNKYLQAIQLFESNQLPDYAYKYSKIAVEFNPNSFDSWKLLYYISKSTPEDKALALKNMKRLDPKNSNVLDKPQP